MLDNMKTRAVTTKRAATEAVAAAGTVVKQRLCATKYAAPKSTTDVVEGYEASLKMPLVADEAPEVLPELPAQPVIAAPSSSSKVEVRVNKLSKVRSALKFTAEQVKSMKTGAVAGAAGKLSTASSTVKGKYHAMRCDAVDKLHGLQSRSAPLLNMLEAEYIDLLVSMGFARKDALTAVRVFGAEDFETIVDFLCQQPGRRASAPNWNARIAECIARRLLELELDEEENVQMALALSRFQAEASEANGMQLNEASQFAEFHCWESADTHVTGMLCTRRDPQAFHLRPSVGTWMMPLPKKPASTNITVQPDLIDLSVASKEGADVVTDNMQDFPIFTGDDEKITEVSSPLRGAVCCGA